MRTFWRILNTSLLCCNIAFSVSLFYSKHYGTRARVKKIIYGSFMLCSFCGMNTHTLWFTENSMWFQYVYWFRPCSVSVVQKPEGVSILYQHYLIVWKIVYVVPVLLLRSLILLQFLLIFSWKFSLSSNKYPSLGHILTLENLEGVMA